MRYRKRDPERLPEAEVIASFGGANIVKYLDGKLEITGGTAQERAEASQWMRQFLQSWPGTVRRLR